MKKKTGDGDGDGHQNQNQSQSQSQSQSQKKARRCEVPAAGRAATTPWILARSDHDPPE
ncbi:MAG: hypothetical protein IPM35_21845 [Myxococcales bacterium]|nr:hypothetical protein [Myxococcales bacterium]